MKWLLSIGALVVGAAMLVLSAWTWWLTSSAGAWSVVERKRARVVEAKVAVTEIAWGVAQCAEQSGKLPPSSAKVPAAVATIRGMVYQSRRSDWGDPAFACAGFHMRRPQSFQYQWVRDDGEQAGYVQADADLDGDGAIDQRVRLDVRCGPEFAPLRCRPDAMPTEPFAPPFAPLLWE